MALEHARDILAYAPHQREAWILASIAHTKLGQHRAALDDLKQALRPDAVGAWSFAVLDILDTAGGLARQSSENQPLCLLAHYYRLLRVVDRSNGPLAVRAARNAIDKGDYPDEAYLTIGVVHYRSQQPEEAFEAFQQSVASNPHNADALHWAAIAYSDRGDLSGEYRMREAARNASPDDPLYSRAFAQLVTAKLGDLHQGLTIAKSALARTPTSSERLAEVGRMYRELGEFEQALAHFVEAIEHTPTEVR
ncbi:MAG: tetratricopeptide repeat protein [Nitrospiraceae bacterium]